MDKLDAMAGHERARLAWLHVHELDDVQDQRLEFGPEINVILGRNGVGKTTLLNVLVCVLSWDFSAWKQRSFDVEYQFELGPWFCRVRVKNTRDRELDRDGVVGFRPEVSLHARYDKFELRGESDRGGCRREINGSRQYRIESVGLRPLSLFSFQLNEPETDVASLIQASLGIGSDVSRFDEGEESFRTILDIVSSEHPLEWMSDAQSVWRVTRNPLGERWRLMPDVSLVNPDAPVLVRHKQLGITQPFLDALGAVDIVANFGLPEIQHQGDTKIVSLSSFELRMVRANGDVLRHTSWSWGQQRLVAFALYLARNKHYVVADELVNGMHHEWIELCRRELDTRQSFVTSQNPILLDYVKLESIEQIQRSFVLCSVKEATAGRTARAWRNMTEREASTLLDAHRVGIQSTSEIMRFHGWW